MFEFGSLLFPSLPFPSLPFLHNHRCAHKHTLTSSCVAMSVSTSSSSGLPMAGGTPPKKRKEKRECKRDRVCREGVCVDREEGVCDERTQRRRRERVWLFCFGGGCGFGLFFWCCCCWFCKLRSHQKQFCMSHHTRSFLKRKAKFEGGKKRRRKEDHSTECRTTTPSRSNLLCFHQEKQDGVQ